MTPEYEEMLSLNGPVNGQPFLAQIIEDLVQGAGGIGYPGVNAGLDSDTSELNPTSLWSPPGYGLLFHPIYVSGA